jgi:hypothetical protein
MDIDTLLEEHVPLDSSQCLPRNYKGLNPPVLNNGEPATGFTTLRLRIENKRRRITKQLQQRFNHKVWKQHNGTTSPSIPHTPRPQHQNNMCPTGLALQHPAAPLLLDYAMHGCPVQMGKPWTKQQIITAIKRGPHVSALEPEAMAHLDAEVQEKVKTRQARLLKWADIQHNPPLELKVSPVAMIPHKSQSCRAILDLSYSVKLSPTMSIPSVNSTTVKTAPKGATDLEMAGLLMLWIVMENVCHPVHGKHVALFSDNSPTVHWVQRLAARHSPIAMQLIRALALRLQIQLASPLTPLHTAGTNNAMTDIPSRSFGSEPKWHCKTDADLLHLFNSSFPLPHQASWTVFHLSSAIATKLISVLRMRPFSMDDWRRLPTARKNIGDAGKPMSHLLDWTHTYRKPHANTELDPCWDLQPEYGPDTTDDNDKSALEQYLRHSRPLAR